MTGRPLPRLPQSPSRQPTAATARRVRDRAHAGRRSLRIRRDHPVRHRCRTAGIPQLIIAPGRMDCTSAGHGGQSGSLISKAPGYKEGGGNSYRIRVSDGCKREALIQSGHRFCSLRCAKTKDVVSYTAAHKLSRDQHLTKLRSRPHQGSSWSAPTGSGDQRPEPSETRSVAAPARRLSGNAQQPPEDRDVAAPRGTMPSS